MLTVTRLCFVFLTQFSNCELACFGYTFSSILLRTDCGVGHKNVQLIVIDLTSSNARTFDTNQNLHVEDIPHMSVMDSTDARNIDEIQLGFIQRNNFTLLFKNRRDHSDMKVLSPKTSPDYMHLFLPSLSLFVVHTHVMTSSQSANTSSPRTLTSGKGQIGLKTTILILLLH